MNPRASYVPNLAAYDDARRSARASVYLFHLRKVPRGRRIYIQNMPSVARRAFVAASDRRIGARAAWNVERSRCGGERI